MPDGSIPSAGASLGAVSTGLDSPKLSHWMHDLRVDGEDLSPRAGSYAMELAALTTGIVHSVLSYYSWYGWFSHTQYGYRNLSTQ